MIKNVVMAVAGAFLLCLSACSREKSAKDRSQADEMFSRICSLTKEYSERLEAAPDSADWASMCSEFEEKLDKISFSYPPDTDLLLTEGQNDTIHSLMQDYVKVRESRIHEILHPVVLLYSLSISDSASLQDASRSLDN